jgi:hypothetical protein
MACDAFHGVAVHGVLFGPRAQSQTPGKTAHIRASSAVYVMERETRKANIKNRHTPN